MGGPRRGVGEEWTGLGRRVLELTGSCGLGNERWGGVSEGPKVLFLSFPYLSTRSPLSTICLFAVSKGLFCFVYSQFLFF